MRREGSPFNGISNLLRVTWLVMRGDPGVRVWGPGPNVTVVKRIKTNTDLFILNLCIHITYVNVNDYLQLQTSRAYILCPVAIEFEEREPQACSPVFPRSLPHLEFLGANVIRTRFH